MLIQPPLWLNGPHFWTPGPLLPLYMVSYGNMAPNMTQNTSHFMYLVSYAGFLYICASMDPIFGFPAPCYPYIGHLPVLWLPRLPYINIPLISGPQY